MNLPEYKDIKIRKTQNGKYEVLDILRHRFVSLTPEEWVRQHFINFLVTERQYPAALMANEIEICVGDKRLRCDSVLFDRSGKPLMIMEYKAESVTLTADVVRQIMTYNMMLHAPYLTVSNGTNHFCLFHDKEAGRWVRLPDIPLYSELIV